VQEMLLTIYSSCFSSETPDRMLICFCGW